MEPLLSQSPVSDAILACAMYDCTSSWSAVHNNIYLFLSVAGRPTGVKISRAGYTSVLVSWTAPSPPLPAGYEVFYQTSNINRFSGGNTSNTELTLTGMQTLGKMNWIFVVAFGEEGAPVLPSPHSTAAVITLCALMHVKHEITK